LLKARFYFDGGYYTKALTELQASETTLRSLRDKTEYFYRMGRVYDRTDKIADAIAYYQKAISLGKSLQYYYAANAALSVGKIYEDRKDYKRAGDYYNQALSMKNHRYQTDIDNDAKAGLKRIGQ
jgi:tetratricopeptide (TPR) repeat protein